MRKIALMVAGLATMTGCGLFGGGGSKDPAPVTRARAELRNAAGASLGQVTLDNTERGVLLTATLSGLPPGTHGFHIHSIGQCSPTFEAAGEHFNPTDKQHGLRNPAGPHAGDLPNLSIPESGTVRIEMLASGVTLAKGRSSLLDSDGSALVVHTFADDHTTDPSGNSGTRVACGVIQR